MIFFMYLHPEIGKFYSGKPFLALQHLQFLELKAPNLSNKQLFIQSRVIFNGIVKGELVERERRKSI